MKITVRKSLRYGDSVRLTEGRAVLIWERMSQAEAYQLGSQLLRAGTTLLAVADTPEPATSGLAPPPAAAPKCTCFSDDLETVPCPIHDNATGFERPRGEI